MGNLNDSGSIYTITQNELPDKVIIEEPPMIDGFFMNGISLLVGAPKVKEAHNAHDFGFHIRFF